MAEKCKSLNDCLEELKKEHISPEDLNRIIDECISILESGKNGYIDQAIIKEILLLLQKHVVSLVGCYQGEIKQLKEKVANFEAIVEQLEEDKQQGLIAIQKLEQDVKEMKESMQRVNNRMQKLEELKGDEQLLLAGQIASNIEAELRGIVLNSVDICNPTICNLKTIPQIRDAINSTNTPYDPIFKSSACKYTAKLNLKHLERKFPKDPDRYYEIIKDLKAIRNVPAHPKLPKYELVPDEAKKDVEDSGIESPLKELIYELLDLMKAIKGHT